MIAADSERIASESLSRTIRFGVRVVFPPERERACAENRARRPAWNSRVDVQTSALSQSREMSGVTDSRVGGQRSCGRFSRASLGRFARRGLSSGRRPAARPQAALWKPRPAGNPRLEVSHQRLTRLLLRMIAYAVARLAQRTAARVSVGDPAPQRSLGDQLGRTSSMGDEQILSEGLRGRSLPGVHLLDDARLAKG